MLEKMHPIPTRKVSDEEALLVHSREHVDFVNSLLDKSVRETVALELERRSAFASEGERQNLCWGMIHIVKGA